MELVKAGLLSAVMQSGGGTVSPEIVDLIETFPVLAQGTFATGVFSYKVKYGTIYGNQIQRNIQEATVGGFHPYIYESIISPWTFFVCIYSGNDLLIAYPTNASNASNAQYFSDDYIHHMCVWEWDSGSTGHWNEYIDKENIPTPNTLAATVNVSYTPSSYRPNYDTYYNATISATISQQIRQIEYSSDGSISRDTTFTANTYAYGYGIPSDYGNVYFTKLSRAEIESLSTGIAFSILNYLQSIS